MKAKLCFDDEIHRISQVPSKVEELREQVRSVFQNRLPECWKIQYKNQNDDNVFISDDKDLEAFHAFGNKGSSLVKLHVIPIDELALSQTKYDEILKKPEDDMEDFQILDSESDKEEKIESKNVFSEIESKSPETERIKSVNLEENSPELKAFKLEREEEPKEEEAQLKKEKNEPELEQLEPKEEIPKIEVLGEKPKIEEEEEMKSPEKPNLEEKQKEVISSQEESKESAEGQKVLVDVDVLEKLMSSVVEKSLPKLLEKNLESSVKEEKEIISQPEKESAFKPTHYGIQCNRCGVLPIVGVRYKCSVCPDFDCCETCEEICPHIHNFIKIKEHSFIDNLKEKELFKSVKEQKEIKPPQKKNPEPKKEDPNLPQYAQKNDYFHIVKEKAVKLQKCFPKEELEILMAYVNGAPMELSFEELVENFKH